MLSSIEITGRTSHRNKKIEAADEKPERDTIVHTDPPTKSRELVGVVLVQNTNGHFKCPANDCTSTFPTEKELNGHLVRKIKDNEECCMCPPGRKLPSFKDYTIRDHVKSHIDNGRKQRCTICGKLVADLVAHTMVKHGSMTEQKYSCWTCKKGFASQKELNAHEKKVHNEDYGICEYCNIELKKKSIRHHHTHSWQKSPFSRARERVKCPFCSITPMRQGFGRHLAQ